ncbi:terminase large subunit [Novosphingobium lindaniclasticum]|uniref:Terminase n=1 Tax=Novosphingobium lindaniclasticum LE124 TaxID=1096930 RepID=T0IJ20_9SPHN|nr:terminase large subunit [Novosphingobium lindaniclasticum]EQB09654.1 terminase [Novosphingobium lindaniclasticum LE124]
MAAPKWSTACLDWQERIVARKSLVPCPPLFPGKAEDALGVFKSLQVVDLPKVVVGEVERHPTLGEVCDDFVFDLVAAIFGAEDPETGKRLISEFMLLISKKNGKSMIAAGIMVTALILNWRPNAILQILAPTLEVANNSFEPAMGMVRADPELSVVLKVIEHQRQIKHLDTGAVLKVIAADSDTVAGGKASITLIEELWLFGKKPKAAAMLREALGGGSARPEAFTLYITTHSDEPPSGVYKTKLAYMRDVRDGVIDDPKTMAMLYEWPVEMLDAEAYLDPAFFYVTNPHIGRSVTVEWLQAELGKEQIGEGEGLQVFLAKHLNVEIGLRLRRDRWRGTDYWEACADKSLTLASLLARSEVAVVGVDGGGLDDLYGLCVAGRERGTGRWLYWFKAWCWPDVLTRRKEIAAQLHDYESDGDLVICSEVVSETLGLDADDTAYERPQDIREIVAVIEEVKASGLLPERGAVGLDPQGVSDLVDALAEIGLEDPQVVSVGQGFRLMSAIVGLARKLKFNGAVHDGSRMMAWCVSNAKEELGRQTVMIVKNTQGTGKIDPFMAGLNATKLLELNPVAANDNGVSVYEDRGLVVF